MEQTFSGCLLVSDVDGTLTTLRNVPDRNREAIRRFVCQGGAFTLATGRNAGALRCILDQISVTAPLILLNGAVVLSHQTGEVWANHLISPQVERMWRQLARLYPEVWVLGVERERYRVLREGADKDSLLREKFAIYLHDDAPHSPQQWNKILYAIHPSAMDSFRRDAQRLKPEDTYLVQTEEYYLECMPNGINKGEALALVASRMGISRERVFAIGDQQNDLELLRWAGVSAAVAAASPQVKKGVDFVAGRCEDGAVADFIEYLEQTLAVDAADTPGPAPAQGCRP